MEPSETRIVSPSYSTAPLYPNHPLTQTSPTLTPSRASYYHSTLRMAMRTQPTMSLGFSARVTEAMTLSPLSFRKRYGSSYETPSSSASPTSSDPSFIKEVVPIKDTAADEPLGLGYGATRRHALELAEGHVPGTFKVGQSSSIPDCTITRSFTSDHPPATIVVDEEEFLEVGAQLELHGSILHGHTQRLDALPPTIFEGSRLLLLSVPYGDQFWPLRPGHDRHTSKDQLCGWLGDDRERRASLERRYGLF
ncbi:hypothetical protein Tco_0211344 [Tanacetum coccineum]